MSGETWAKGFVSGAWRALTGRRKERGGSRRRSRRGRGPGESVPAEDVARPVSSTHGAEGGAPHATGLPPAHIPAHEHKRAPRAVAPPAAPSSDGQHAPHVTPPRVPRAARDDTRGSKTRHPRQQAAWAPPTAPGGARLHVQVSQPRAISSKSSSGSGDAFGEDDSATHVAHIKDTARARHLFASRSGSSSFSGAESPLFGGVTPAHAMLHEFGRVPESGESRFSTPHGGSPMGDTSMFGGGALYATPHGTPSDAHTPTGTLRGRTRLRVAVDIVAGAGPDAESEEGAGAGAGAGGAAAATNAETVVDNGEVVKGDVAWPQRVLLLRACALAEVLVRELWPTAAEVEAAAARRARYAHIASRPARVWVLLAPSA